MLNIFVAIILIISLPVYAQSSRDRLDGFGDIKFGTSLENAKKILKINSVEEDSSNRSLYIKRQEQVGGILFDVNYYFDQSKINMIQLSLVEKQNCHIRAAQIEGMIESKYGRASSKSKDILLIGEWIFSDGGAIVVTSLDGGKRLGGDCKLLVIYRQSRGGKSF